MKFLIVIAWLFGPCNVLFAQSQLEVVVSNVKSDKGNVRVGIFKDEKTFLKDATYGKVVKANSGQTTVVFEDLPPGTYAVSIIHDENENNELDTNLLGIPNEGIGFANDAMGTFGPPDFEKASITVETGKKSVVIRMRYL
jgi:uncharacterized protein (DUF2141 family)